MTNLPFGQIQKLRQAGPDRPVYEGPIRTHGGVLRDILLAAAEVETWLSLDELRKLTGYGEASISALIRQLKRPEFGGHRVVKRRREYPTWEYTIVKGDSRQKAARQV